MKKIQTPNLNSVLFLCFVVTDGSTELAVLET